MNENLLGLISTIATIIPARRAIEIMTAAAIREHFFVHTLDSVSSPPILRASPSAIFELVHSLFSILSFFIIAIHKCKNHEEFDYFKSHNALFCCLVSHDFFPAKIYNDKYMNIYFELRLCVYILLDIAE